MSRADNNRNCVNLFVRFGDILKSELLFFFQEIFFFEKQDRSSRYNKSNKARNKLEFEMENGSELKNPPKSTT